MQAQATLRAGRMSIRLFVALAALVVAFVLGGASGYVVKALSVPTSTSTQVVMPQSTPRNGGPGGQIGDTPHPSPQRTILPNQA